MTIVVALFGLLIFGIGIFGLVNPRGLIGIIAGIESKTRMWVAVLVRLVLGVLLILAAPSCKAPTVVWVFGVIALVAAAAIPVIGRKRMDAFIDWWIRQQAPVIRLSATFAAGMGAFLIWASA